VVHRQLVADRFVVVRERTVVDLASGEHAWLTTSTSGTAADTLRWTNRCDWLFGIRHRALAELLDYGALDRANRFEAWRCGGVWSDAHGEGERLRATVSSFLRANGRSADLADSTMHVGPGRQPLVVPGSQDGCEEPSHQSDLGRPDLQLMECGHALAERRAVSAITDLFQDDAACRPRVIAIGAARRAGLTTAITALARAARCNGFVPVCCPALEPFIDLLEGRSLFLITETDRGSASWQQFLRVIVRSPRPHVVVLITRDTVDAVPLVWLERLDDESLAASIRPFVVGAPVAKRVATAIKRARGLPGRFADVLWGKQPREPVPTHFTQAAERPTTYGDESAGPEDPQPVDSSGAHAGVPYATWPAPREITALKQKIDTAAQLITAGRHAPGERLLRVAIAGLSRRHDWDGALTGTLRLASSLLRRGRARDAQETLSDADERMRKAGVDGNALQLAVLSGVARLDLGRLDEAEAILSAALKAATSMGDPVGAISGRLAMARCLFWRGRFDEARLILPGHDGLQTDASVGVAAIASRIAVGTRELDTAMTNAVTARETAERTGDARLISAGWYAQAFAHLAVGDYDAVARDADRCIESARTARDCLRAVRVRLLAAEGQRRSGKPGQAAALISRLARVPARSIPTTVCARWALLRDLLEGVAPAEAVKRQVAETGLTALALFAPPAASVMSDTAAAATQDVVDILSVCQVARDDATIVADLCARLRTQLHAASIGLFIVDGGDVVPITMVGSARCEKEIARRVVTVGQSVPPHRRLDVVEGGAPVKMAGESIGALVARWTLAGDVDPHRTSLLLTTGATAVAPAVAAVIAKRAASAVRLEHDLLGSSAAMEEVRRSIERSASAPFPVLVEGESGSGKELVARALHRRSPRRDRPFCAVNCAALPDDLVEAELFGFARGAFTGAVAERAGVFEEAHTGTLFLDEIGELSPRAQAKVLRTIQEGELRRVGENIARRVDVRIVSASNRDLRQEVAMGGFRRDLLYRLDVIRITLPPLRDRREDIAILVERFWREATERIGSRAVLSSATVAALARYDWPGNVRELQNVLASLAVRSPRRGVVVPMALPPSFADVQPSSSWRLDAARRTFEEQFVRATLVRTGGHRGRAADELGVTRQGLAKLMARLGITESEHAAMAPVAE
jgi:DNA-binding NtrC family response regulator